MASEEVFAAAGGPLPFESALDELTRSIRGDIIRDSDDRFEHVRRVWNGTVDRHPRVIVRPRGNVDVVRALAFAREQGLPVSVRGGGHNVAGTAIADGGVVVDLALMSDVRVDTNRGVVHVGGGATLGDLDHETVPLGYAVPVGVVSATGVAGLALHGGLGFLSRRLGLTCDSLVGADVVTADGTLITVTESEHSDLLWALRGGGGNFGVVTRLEFRLHPVNPDVWIGLVMYPLSEAPKVAQAFRTFMADAPEEMMGIIVYWSTPLEDPVPVENRGLPTIAVAVCWSGDMALGEQMTLPMRTITAPLADMSGPIPYAIAQQLFDPEFPPGQRHYWKSIFLRELSDAAIEALTRQAATRPSPMTSLDVWALGGAYAREPNGGSAFAHRDKPFLIAFEANWTDPADDASNVAWARSAYDEMKAFSGGGVYLNFPGTEEEANGTIDASYDANLRRLQRIKAQYDPMNVFRSNANITPATDPDIVLAPDGAASTVGDR
jgi:FAD/FMN-containing dehydrogenase